MKNKMNNFIVSALYNAKRSSRPLTSSELTEQFVSNHSEVFKKRREKYVKENKDYSDEFIKSRLRCEIVKEVTLTSKYVRIIKIGDGYNNLYALNKEGEKYYVLNKNQIDI